ncbi:hypothetical protein OROGR_002364 [Orobanche gracilis]
MSTTPNRRLHEDSGSGSGSGNQSQPSALKFSHDDQGTYSVASGRAVVLPRYDYHAPYDVGLEVRMSKIGQRNDSRDADRRSSLHPNMFRVSTPNDPRTDHVSKETRMEFRDSKYSIKEIKVDIPEVKSESRELQQTTKCDIYEGQADESKDFKHERDAYSEHKGYAKMDKDANSGSNSQLNWKGIGEQHRLNQYPDVPGVNADTWHMSHTGLHGLTDAAKGSLHVDNRGITEVRESVGENKVDMKEDDRFKDRDRKRKEVKHWDWGERDKERSDWRYNFPPGNDSSENKVVKEERESERWGSEKKELLKEKEKLNEKENDHVKMELWSSTDKEVSHNEKEVVDRETRDRKKERDADVGPERPDKRSRYHEKELDEGGMLAEGGMEWERDVFNCGVQPRKRMLRPRSSPQTGNSPRHKSGTNDNEGSHGKLKVLRYAEGKGDVSCVAYKIGECMKELVNLWKEYELLQADKACEGSQSGPTLEILISAEHVTATNHQVRGYCRPTASPPPATQELRATIRMLPPQD